MEYTKRLQSLLDLMRRKGVAETAYTLTNRDGLAADVREVQAAIKKLAGDQKRFYKRKAVRE